VIDHPDIEAVERPAMVLLSGGQDSTTCLAWALRKFEEVHCVSFDYDQRHRVELDVGAKIAEIMGVPRTVLHVPALSEIGAASLTNAGIPSEMDAEGTGNVYAAEHNLPSSFVPARNAILLSTAMALAAPMGIYDLVTGVCEEDEAGYPDCRSDFVVAMEDCLECALADGRVSIAAPLLHLSKASTFALADDLNALEVVLDYSHTCYNGEHKTRHEWGFGCGECPACQTRRRGFEEFETARSPF
jgi:7-cyano-7-deazaguanine synthase